MWSFTTTALVVILGSTHLIGLCVADRDLVFPFVKRGLAGNDTDEWKDFHARVMEVNNDVTTYSVGCATNPCAGWGNLPKFTYTIAIGQNTFDMRYSDLPFLSTRTACTFTGDFPTKASCEMTNSGRIATITRGYEHHFTVPDTTDMWNIMRATMRVLDGTVAPTPVTTGSTIMTTSSPRPTSISTGSRTIVGSNPVSTGGTAASAAGSSSVSSGKAERTGAPWVLGVGMVAGAVLGL
ncbi:hypothetical protein B0J11DRAFT_169291 [Dendryphion nanum]|uniref:Uncharacterized protein n=1 Tax=Dendryphion nanum TaxID=256645 RepID=A0A9P9EE35_9PLEO|nr:hypothetical protein B0J11DRAFT_169291 [Dendryphion nanum]